jgi:hypothetical protein
MNPQVNPQNRVFERHMLLPSSQSRDPAEGSRAAVPFACSDSTLTTGRTSSQAGRGRWTTTATPLSQLKSTTYPAFRVPETDGPESPLVGSAGPPEQLVPSV